MAEIQLSGVSMVYPNGTQALKQVDLTVPDHEFIVLLGRPAAEKHAFASDRRAGKADGGDAPL